MAVALACAWGSSARAAPDSATTNQLVVLGLRPTTGANGPTEIRRLAEAQKSRSLIESLLQLISGHDVVGHEDLRQLLGDSYMVDLFDCTDRLGCITARLVQLKRSGYTTAVYGTYWVDGDTFHFRVFTFSLATGRPLKHVEFDLAGAQLENADAWRPELDKLFTNKGRVVIASNIPDFQCTVDSEPCSFGPDGHSLSLTSGEHVIQLSKKGYKAATRVVNIAEASDQRVAVPLEQQPIAAPAASRTDIEVPASSDEAPPGVAVAGQITFGAVVEPYDTVDNINNPSPAPGALRYWHVGANIVPSYIGAIFNDTKRGNWRFSGFLYAGLFPGHLFRLPIAGVALVNANAGLTINAGRLFTPTVNVTTPGLFLAQAQGTGEFSYGFDGVKMSKSFGHLVLDIGIGRPETFTEADPLPPSSGFDAYDVEYRLQYLMPEHAVSLYGKKTPMMVAVSGALGEHRVGLNETVPMGDATPIQQNLPFWVFSGELILPLGPLVLSSGGYDGQGANYFSGAIFQGDRLDPVTGEHRLLRSWGAWAQLSLPLGPFELMMMFGQDNVYKNLAWGIDAHGLATQAEWNRLSAVMATYDLSKRLRVGEELILYQTQYRTGESSYPGAVSAIWFHF